MLFHWTPSSTQLHTLPWLPLGLNKDHELTPYNYTLWVPVGCPAPSNCADWCPLTKWLHLHYVYVEQIQSNGLILLIPSYWRTRSQSDISSSWWKNSPIRSPNPAFKEGVYQHSQRETECQSLLLRPRNWLISVIEVFVNLKVWRPKNYESSNSTSVESP